MTAFSKLIRRALHHGPLAGTAQGYLDAIAGGVLHGWAVDAQQPGGPATVTVRCNGRPIGTALANLHRPDLAQAGVGDGNHGFAFEVPVDLEGELTASVNGSKLRNTLRAPGDLPEFGPHVRWFLAKEYLRGEGIEVGALDKPMRVPDGVRVRLCDRLTTEELRAHYGIPEAAPVDFVCDAHTLETVESGTQDFVVANHVFEHMENPLLALQNWVRALKPGGVVFMAIPDKRFTFDRDRQVTPLEHILDEQAHPEKTAANRTPHYLEWIHDVEHEAGDVQARLEFLLAIQYSIHFHCWTATGLMELFSSASSSLGYEIECYRFNQPECIFVLKRN